jgi:hypothetical protein
MAIDFRRIRASKYQYPLCVLICVGRKEVWSAWCVTPCGVLSTRVYVHVCKNWTLVHLLARELLS